MSVTLKIGKNIYRYYFRIIQHHVFQKYQRECYIDLFFLNFAFLNLSMILYCLISNPLNLVCC